MTRLFKTALRLEELETRAVPTVSSIVSNFNGTAIPAGDTVWFSSVAKVQGVGAGPVTVRVTGQTVTFTANGTPYSLNIPDTAVTLSAATTMATTDFSAGAWAVSAPAQFSGNVFLAGWAFPTAAGLPGGIKNVTWRGDFTADKPGLAVNWQWAAADYTQFGNEPTTFGVKATDDNHVDAYHNSDHAGTPENFKTFVTGGARGGGGSNFTGSYSATGAVVPSVVVQNPTASLSGYVYVDTNLNAVRDANEGGISPATVTLQGIDAQGQAVNLTATTDENGFYSFTGLSPGTYSLTLTQPGGVVTTSVSAGSQGGQADTANAQITGIVLAAGVNGVENDFGEFNPA
jgi:SdrD B-like domain